MDTNPSLRSTSEPTKIDFQATTEVLPRLLQLGDVLTDFRADANAAHEARMSGKPRGAVSGLSNLDREFPGAVAPG